MAEYIEREAAIDAIMKVYVRTAGYKARERVFKAEEAVYHLPVADVAPVVRCKDCKQLQCCNFTQFLGVDGYCSYGEYKRNTEGIKWQTKR